MRYGTPLSAGYGSFANMCRYVKFSTTRLTNNAKLYVMFMPSANLGNSWYGVYNNNILVQNIYCPEAVEQRIMVPATPGKPRYVVDIIRLGQYGDAGYSVPRVTRIDEVSDSQRATIQWTWRPTVAGADGEGQYTSAWSFAYGTVTRLNSIPSSAITTQSYLTFDLVVSAGTATITMYGPNNVVVATGSGAVGGSITLTQSNSSGISGSVTVSGGATTKTGATLWFNWPSALNVLRGLSNPPSVVVATVNFDGKDAGIWSEPSDLAANTYYYEIQFVSNTGKVGTATAATSLVVNGPPAAPTNLAYSSGSQAAIVMSFTPSTTTGATYRAYVSTVNGAAMSMNDINATASAGASTITLGALTGYPGTYYVVVRAVKSGFEEKNINMVAITLDASGNYVALQPNQPTLSKNSVVITSGRTLAITAKYATKDAQATATSIQLFSRVPGGSYNLASPLTSASLANTSTGIQSANLNYTFLADGLVYLTACAVTAGGTQSVQAPEIGPFDPSNATVAAPDLFSMTVSRG